MWQLFFEGIQLLQQEKRKHYLMCRDLQTIQQRQCETRDEVVG